MLVPPQFKSIDWAVCWHKILLATFRWQFWFGWTHTYTLLIVHLGEHTKVSNLGRKLQLVAPTCLTKTAAFKFCLMLSRTRSSLVGLCLPCHFLACVWAENLQRAVLWKFLCPYKQYRSQNAVAAAMQFMQQKLQVFVLLLLLRSTEASWMQQAMQGKMLRSPTN